MALCQEVLERLNILFLGFSASGWLAFIVAFGSQQISLDPVIKAISFLFVPWWFAACAGPVLYLMIGIYVLLGPRYRIGGIFGSIAAFISFIYIVALAAPLFTVATLGLTAVTGIDEALDALTIPSLRETINLGPFDFLTAALDAVVNLFENAIRGIIYVILVIFFDHFLTAIKSQFVGSFTSMFFLCLSMMLWPFMKPTKYPKICKTC